MAEALTPIHPSEVVTSEAPQSRLSPGQIAQPYEMLGSDLDKLGQGLEQVAVPLAERAGAQAVTRDDQGNIQVEHMPIFGLAGDAYARAVKVGALAEADGSAKRADIALRDQFRDDPQGYQVAADAYKQKTIKDMTASAGPEVGVAVGRAIDATTTQTYRGLLNEKERLDLQRADGAITAQLNSASDDAVALARQGVGVDTPEMKQILGKYTSLLDEKLKNPRLAYTQEQHDLDLQSFQGEMAGARNLYHVDDVYKKQGYLAAVDASKDVLTNPDYKLTPAQRQGFFSRSMGEIRANEAIRRQDIGEARESFRQLSTASQLGQRIEPDEVENVRQAFRAANYPAGVAAVDAAFAHKDLHDDFGRLPLDQQTQELNTIRGAAAARSTYQYFTGKGYSPQAAAAIAGHVIHESGGNPAAVGDAGTSGGLAQFHNERLANLKAYASSVGKPATDFQTQLDFIDRELHTTEAPTLARLQAAQTPEEAATAFMGYERPQGYTPQNPAGGLGYAHRVALTKSVYQGQAVDGSGGPGVASWLIANRSASIDDSSTKAWKQVMDDWSAGKGGGPSNDRVNQIVDAARATGNIDLQAKIARDMDVIDKVQRISQLPVSQQNAVELELRRRQAEGTSAPGAELVEKQLLARTEAIQKGIQDNPVATAIANFPDKFKTPEPLDFSDPGKLAAGLKTRAQISDIGAANWQSGRLSPIDSTDVAQIQGALKGQGGQVALEGLRQGLKPEELGALFDNTKLGESITGMSRSGDPAKMNAAYSFMDSQQRQNPLQFDRQFPDGLKDLRAWQSNLAFYPPDEAAKRLMRQYDPAQSAAMEASTKVADTALKNVSAANVVSKFSTGFGPIGTGARPPVGMDAGIAAGALKADYDKNYRDGFAATGDPGMADKFAMEKLGNKYAMSPANGNRVMANAPERYYPQVDGSHDWIGQQLDHDLAEVTGGKMFSGERISPKQGPRYASPSTDAGAFASRQYMANRAIVPDSTTETDIANKKPPSYQVVLQDPATGRWGAMQDATGAPRRIRFDPTQVFAQHAARAEAAREMLPPADGPPMVP